MADVIRVKLPDNSVQEVPKGTTPLDIAKGISPRLAQAALVAKVTPSNSDHGSADKDESKLVDLTRPLDHDVDVRILTEKDPEALQVFRHSSAHLMAAAVLEL